MRVDFAQFCADYDVALVVPSRDRAELLARKSDLLLPAYHLFYSGEGYEDADLNTVARHEVPRGLLGITAVRNYILDTLPHRIVIFADDDLNMVYWVAGRRSVRLDRERVALMLLNMTIHALDQGSVMFGPSQVDIRKSSPLVPFRHRAVCTSVYGVVGRDFRFDERNMLKSDYDFALQTLVSARTVHLDMRYYAAGDRDATAGGNMEFRTQERRKREIENLIAWWGTDVISASDNKGNERLQVNVP